MHHRMFASFKSAAPTWGANTVHTLYTDTLLGNSIYKGYYVGTESSTVGETDTFSPNTVNGPALIYLYTVSTTSSMAISTYGYYTAQGLFKKFSVLGQTFDADNPALFSGAYFDDKSQTQYYSYWLYESLSSVFADATSYNVEFSYYNLDGGLTVTIGANGTTSYGKIGGTGSFSSQTMSDAVGAACYYFPSGNITLIAFNNLNNTISVTYGPTIKCTYNGTTYEFARYLGYAQGYHFYSYTGDCFNMNAGTVGQTRDITFSSAVPI